MVKSKSNKPSKPIKIIKPSPLTTSFDSRSRSVSPKLNEKLNVQFEPEKKAPIKKKKEKQKPRITTTTKAAEQAKFGQQLTLELDRDMKIKMNQEQEKKSILSDSSSSQNTEKKTSASIDHTQKHLEKGNESKIETKPLVKKKHKRPKPEYIKGFKVSEKWIRLLTLLLLFYFACLLFFSFLDLTFGAKLWINVASKQFILENFIFRRMPYLIFALGFFELITSAISFFSFLRCRQICESNVEELPIEKVQKVYKYIKISRWLNICLILAIFCFWITSFFNTKSIEMAVKKDLKNSINMYSLDLRIKKELNTLQITYQCCGVESYKDWTFKAWYEISDKPAIYNQVYNRIYNQLEDVPFSCCKLNILTYCVYYDIEKKAIIYKNQPLKMFSINKKGCAQVIVQEFGSLNKFRGLVFFMSIIVFIIFRIVETNFYTGRILKNEPLSYILYKERKF